MDSPTSPTGSLASTAPVEVAVETTSSSTAPPPRLAGRFRLLAQAAEMSASSDETQGPSQDATPDSPPSQTLSPSPSPAVSGSARTTSANPPAGEGPKQARRKRWTGVRNCDACRIRKSKCDRLRPCSNCAFRNVKCTYDEAFDSFPMVAVEHNLADISRLCQNVFALARCLNMPSDELDKLALLADELIDQERPKPRTAAENSDATKRRRSLGEILRTNPQFASLDTDLAAKRQAASARSEATTIRTPRPEIPHAHAYDGRSVTAPAPRPPSAAHVRQGPPLVYHPMQPVAPQVFVYGPGAYPAVVPPWSHGVSPTDLALRSIYPPAAGLYSCAQPASVHVPYHPALYPQLRPPKAHALPRRPTSSSGRLSPAVLPPLAIPSRPLSHTGAANRSAIAPSTATPSTAVSALTPFRSAHAPTSATTPPSAQPSGGRSPSSLPHGGLYVLPPVQPKKPSPDSFSTHLASFASTIRTASAPPSPPIRLAPLRSVVSTEDVKMADEVKRDASAQEAGRRLPSLSNALFRGQSGG